MAVKLQNQKITNITLFFLQVGETTGVAAAPEDRTTDAKSLASEWTPTDGPPPRSRRRLPNPHRPTTPA